MLKRALAIIAVSGIVASPASAHGVSSLEVLETAKPYAPYEFLIGDWYATLKQENAVVHQQFGWGPGKASMTDATYVVVPGKPEHLHFGGTMLWNPASKALDYLFAVEPGSGVEERGTFSVQSDGSVIREVEAIYPEGRVMKSRQVFKPLPDGTFSMDLLSGTAAGWASTLPNGPMIFSKSAPK